MECIDFGAVTARLNLAFGENQEAAKEVKALDLEGAAENYDQMADHLAAAIALMNADTDIQSQWVVIQDIIVDMAQELRETSILSPTPRLDRLIARLDENVTAAIDTFQDAAASC
jgi:hypothetical protein